MFLSKAHQFHAAQPPSPISIAEKMHSVNRYHVIMLKVVIRSDVVMRNSSL